MDERTMIDIHVHLAAVPDGKNGCEISPRMLRNPITRFVAWSMGLPLARPVDANRIYLEKLVADLRASRYVRQAVLLGIDGTYDSTGRLDKTKTSFLISNDAVFAAVRAHPDLFLAGVSINPQRQDALSELERCAQSGAVLVKVLPNAQGFDPADPRYTEFWQTMARLKLPLLCHTGVEYTVSSGSQDLGDPEHLRPVLEYGVTVIAAHGMSTGSFFREKYWDLLEEYVKKYPHFYCDWSALSLLNRAGMLLRLSKHPTLHSRIFFGTDYPLPVFAFPALLSGKWKGFLELRRIKNRFDRQYRLLQILGCRVESFQTVKSVQK